jgi:uncharacterized protein YqgC (DUF456 family)
VTPILIALGVTLFNLLCVALTLLQLPGLWLMLLAALLLKLLYPPELFSWTTLGVAAGITILAEISEFAAGAVGAKSAGATQRGMWGAVIGGIVGALAGTVMIPIPIVGTLIGAALGSGLVAAGFELTHKDAQMNHAAKVAGGAAVGRFTAAVLKLAFAAVLAVVLTWAVWAP